MALIAEFSVVGTPIPQGSNRAFIRGGKPRIVAGNQGPLERWRGDVRSAVRPALGRWTGPGLPIAGPVGMRLDFRFARPKGHYHPANSRRAAPELRAGAPATPANGPDLDKLCRAVLDALTAVVYVDDALVVQLGATKAYADQAPPGVDVKVVAL